MTNQLRKNLHPKLANLFSAPAYDPSCDPYCNSARAQAPLAKKLLFTPHAYIQNIISDPSTVERELASIEGSWSPYDNDVLSKRGAGKSTYWTAKFLRNFSDDPDFGFGETTDFLIKQGQEEYIKNGRCAPEHLKPTTLWDKLPHISSLASQVATVELCDRILISRVAGGERINWHSHCQYEQLYSHAYIHIPLVTNPQAEMIVYMGGAYYVQHYERFTAWIINTQHNHAVNNPHTQDRYHLLILASLEDPKLRHLL